MATLHRASRPRPTDAPRRAARCLGLLVLSGLLALSACVADVGGEALDDDERQVSSSEFAILEGIVSHEGQRVPGLTVSIFHPDHGRFPAATTDENGYFLFPPLPVLEGTSYLEVYWGSELIYRAAIEIGESLFWDVDIK